MLAVRYKDGLISLWPGAEEESIDEAVSPSDVVEDARLVLGYEGRVAIVRIRHRPTQWMAEDVVTFYLVSEDELRRLVGSQEADRLLGSFFGS